MPNTAPRAVTALRFLRSTRGKGRWLRHCSCRQWSPVSSSSRTSSKPCWDYRPCESPSSAQSLRRWLSAALLGTPGPRFCRARCAATVFSLPTDRGWPSSPPPAGRSSSCPVSPSSTGSQPPFGRLHRGCARARHSAEQRRCAARASRRRWTRSSSSWRLRTPRSVCCPFSSSTGSSTCIMP